MVIDLISDSRIFIHLINEMQLFLGFVYPISGTIAERFRKRKTAFNIFVAFA
jgi:hypothetical protein